MPTIQPLKAGLLVPVFALRNDHDLGIGDTACVRELIDWASELGIGFLQFLPINATGTDSSPYNAISSVALDYLTLDLHPQRVPEVDEAYYRTLSRFLVRSSQQEPAVNYPMVRRVKTLLLKNAFQKLKSHRHEKLQAFCAEEKAWLDDFCLFRVLMEREGHEDWTQWPAEIGSAQAARAWLADRRQAGDGEVEQALLYHAYVQWLCFQQWKETRTYALQKGVKLMGDIPFGVSWCSADVFFQPEFFDLEWCGGAPPETYFKDDLFVQRWGQNWGIPLYRWDVMEKTDYAWWQQRVRKLTEVFDIFRIDHVLGFYRIYSFPWRPVRNAEFLHLNQDEAAARTGGRLPHFKVFDDDTEEHRRANLEAGDCYLRMIIAAAAPAAVVGEDLGTVPVYVRPHLLSLDVPGFKICHWEEDAEGRVVQGADYPNCAFTTYATHDHEPMKTHWEHRRAELSAEDASTRALAARELRFLADFAGLPFANEPATAYPPYDAEIRHALLAAMLGSKARFAALMLTDLFGLDLRFNVPGIASGENWSARLPMTVKALKSDPAWQDDALWLQDLLLKTGRVSS